MKRFLAPVLAFIIGLALSSGVQAQQQTDRPDNTGVNERDRGNNFPTADQQKGSPGDVKMTQDIRRSIVRDKSLSTYARPRPARATALDPEVRRSTGHEKPPVDEIAPLL
jgi:hypothetical protein